MFNIREFTWAGWASVVSRVRENMELDQVEFGTMLGGFSRGQVARYESGENEPSVAFWIRFTKVTSLSLTWVLTGLGDPYEAVFQRLPDFDEFKRWMVLGAERERLQDSVIGAVEHIGEKVDPARVEPAEDLDQAIEDVSRVGKGRGSRRSKRRKAGG